jgi:hypothetical protein
MNTAKFAAALRLLVEAFEASTPIPESSPPVATPAAPKRGPGRPPKGVEGAPQPSTPISAPSAGTSQATSAPEVAQTAEKPLTHKDLAPIFLAAAKKHGRAFVVQAMKALGATGDPEPTFDKVPVSALLRAKAIFEAGPKQAPPADDGADLLG